MTTPSSMAEPALFYVWVYVPSAVRKNYAAGICAKSFDWRHEFEMDDYNEDHVAMQIFAAIPPQDEPLDFYSANEMDAPVSAGLCAALKAIAQHASSIGAPEAMAQADERFDAGYQMAIEHCLRICQIDD